MTERELEVWCFGRRAGVLLDEIVDLIERRAQVLIEATLPAGGSRG